MKLYLPVETTQTLMLNMYNIAKTTNQEKN